jgi:hypothetical protein
LAFHTNEQAAYEQITSAWQSLGSPEAVTDEEKPTEEPTPTSEPVTIAPTPHESATPVLVKGKSASDVIRNQMRARQDKLHKQREESEAKIKAKVKETKAQTLPTASAKQSLIPEGPPITNLIRFAQAFVFYFVGICLLSFPISSIWTRGRRF